MTYQSGGMLIYAEDTFDNKVLQLQFQKNSVRLDAMNQN